MNNKQTRVEKDSMGEIEVPADALYGAQTQRAVNNFPISGSMLPRPVIRALGLIKHACATTNHHLALLDEARTVAITLASAAVAEGRYDDQFPIDVFQTGSGTSSNMNANEVIATLASRGSGMQVHPNDHVNMGQSSNDVFPAAIHVAAALLVNEALIPALNKLESSLSRRIDELGRVVKTGRTHLMDAMPVTLGQEISGWRDQIGRAKSRIQQAATGVLDLPLGGTAVGTGINAAEGFAEGCALALNDLTGLNFRVRDNFFSGLSGQDDAVALSGQLKSLAVAMMKIANDLRWMNSGPLAGLGEITLPALQPGSSIMPGKINPVIPEAVAMVCAEVIGNDTTITLAGQSGNFQLNVMLPVLAKNLSASIELLSNACTVLAEKAIDGFVVNEAVLNESLERNPILVTALNPVIGYELGAKIAKRAYAENRAVKDIALEMTDLGEAELDRLLDPYKLTLGGLTK
ncbi:MAG TPA: class II fumarate hydratase [Gammaproteobacteria bacterium]|nr:fumarate hydratase class II [bacterium BMS3Abin11]HDH15049.1 class II fumarate hydratase [Gammaproteobacteria bacterium]HDZ79062.1 class II fumarate hydratase [Gammaproteobacteria bacterium]